MSELYDRADNMFGELVIPESFSEALSYAEQLIWLYLHKQNELIEGENITITDNGDGTVTISASMDGVKGIDRIESTVETDKTVVVIYYTDGTHQSFNVLAGPQGPQGVQGIPGQDGAPGAKGDPGLGIKSIDVANVETATVETKATRINPDESSVSQTFQKQVPKRSVLTITYDDDTTDTVYAYAGASTYIGETIRDLSVTPNTHTIKFKMYNPADGMVSSLQEITITDGVPGPQGIPGNGIENIETLRSGTIPAREGTLPVISEQTTWDANTQHTIGDLVMNVGANAASIRPQSFTFDGKTFTTVCNMTAGCNIPFKIYSACTVVLYFQPTSALTVRIRNTDTDQVIDSWSVSQALRRRETAISDAGNYVFEVIGSSSVSYITYVEIDIPANTVTIQGTQIAITETDGDETVFNIPDGQDGRDGQDGAPGTDGRNGTQIWNTTDDYTTPNYTFNISDLSGVSGTTPAVDDIIIQNVNRRTFLFTINTVDSTTVLCDYFCEITGATGATGPAGQGVPAGGTAGQTLVKNSASDYDAIWDNSLSGIIDLIINRTVTDTWRRDGGTPTIKSSAMYIGMDIFCGTSTSAYVGRSPGFMKFLNVTFSTFDIVSDLTAWSTLGEVQISTNCQTYPLIGSGTLIVAPYGSTEILRFALGLLTLTDSNSNVITVPVAINYSHYIMSYDASTHTYVYKYTITLRVAALLKAGTYTSVTLWY